MTEQTKTWIDKSTWNEGEWQSEPDRVEWNDEVSGYPCLLKRNKMDGYWCGYVAIPQNHSCYEKETEELDNLVEVHGGVTYTNHCQSDPRFQDYELICHRTEQEDKVWWVGFDCWHSEDLSPASKLPPNCLVPGAEYRNVEYVREQTKNLAAQLMKLDRKASNLVSS